MISIPRPPLKSSTAAVWRFAGRIYDPSQRPLIAGILNVTPDSFSDGGIYADPDVAAARALEMERQGADFIDIGAESTRPGAEPVSQAEELRRLLPVLRSVSSSIKIPISVDTYKPEVMRQALAAGASVVNDVSALEEGPGGARAAAEAGAGMILMHKRGTPQTMQMDTQYGDLFEEVVSSLRNAVECAVRAGVPKEAIAVDPGIGFGKSAQGNCELIARVEELKRRVGRPVMIGLSRKSFLERITGPAIPSEAANAAAHSLALIYGASILRVHDVPAALAAVRLFIATRRPVSETV